VFLPECKLKATTENGLDLKHNTVVVVVVVVLTTVIFHLFFQLLHLEYRV